MKTIPTYILKRHQRAKQLKIKLDSTGAVLVTAPKYIPKVFIDQFVKKNQNWIKNQQQIRESKPKFNTKEFVYIFGKKYFKQLKFSLTAKIGIYTKGDKLIYNPTTPPKINTREDQSKWEKRFQTKLDNFLKNTATHYILARTNQLAQKMSLNFNKITLRKQKTRWGSCSSKKNLNFNWKLVHFRTPIIDYVIIHELAHLVQMNHSRKFWSLVAQYDPAYKKHVGWLRRNGLNLE